MKLLHDSQTENPYRSARDAYKRRWDLFRAHVNFAADPDIGGGGGGGGGTDDDDAGDGGGSGGQTGDAGSANQIDPVKHQRVVEDRNRKGKLYLDEKRAREAAEAELAKYKNKDKTEGQQAIERNQQLEAEVAQLRAETDLQRRINQAHQAGVQPKYAKLAAMQLAEAEADLAEGEDLADDWWAKHQQKNAELYPPAAGETDQGDGGDQTDNAGDDNAAGDGSVNPPPKGGAGGPASGGGSMDAAAKIKAIDEQIAAGRRNATLSLPAEARLLAQRESIKAGLGGGS